VSCKACWVGGRDLNADAVSEQARVLFHGHDASMGRKGAVSCAAGDRLEQRDVPRLDPRVPGRERATCQRSREVFYEPPVAPGFAVGVRHDRDTGPAIDAGDSSKGTPRRTRLSQNSQGTPLRPSGYITTSRSRGACLRHDARELPRQGSTRARVIGAREPLLVGGETAHVVHLEEQLPGAKRIARVLPGQLEQSEAVGRSLVVSDEVVIQ